MKIEVFFEKNMTAERVAVFEDDDMYMVCLKSLEKEARKGGYIVTERMVNCDDCNIEKEMNNAWNKLTYSASIDPNKGTVHLNGVTKGQFKRVARQLIQRVAK